MCSIAILTWVISPQYNGINNHKTGIFYETLSKILIKSELFAKDPFNFRTYQVFSHYPHRPLMNAY